MITGHLINRFYYPRHVKHQRYAHFSDTHIHKNVLINNFYVKRKYIFGKRFIRIAKSRYRGFIRG